MIYIHRIWGRVPQEIFDALDQAATALDGIPGAEERKAFIKSKSDYWTALRKYLKEFSYNKCWYSESREDVSLMHVDHFRPHGRSKQAQAIFHNGYCWLAFDKDNFRLAGGLCNSVNKEYSDESIGKGEWFPLLDPSLRATLAHRSTAFETPMLLDPTDPHDPYMLTFDDNGKIGPVKDLTDHDRDRVDISIRHLGLAQNALNRARCERWRICSRKIEQYNRIARQPKGQQSENDRMTMREFVQELIGMQNPRSEFASVVRCCLEKNGLKYLVTKEELSPLAWLP